MSAFVISRPRAALKLAAMSLAAVYLAACSYTLTREEAPIALPLAWDSVPDPQAAAVVPVDWWKTFNSPVLNNLVEIALRDNPNLIATEERLRQAERNFARSREDLFPDLSVSASTSRRRTGGNEQAEFTNDSTSLGLSTSYQVDIFGGAAARYRGQVATFIGQKYDADLARITLAANVARAYFNLLSVRSRLLVDRRNLEIAEDVLRINEARQREGILRAFDVSQQTTQVLQQRTNLINLENQVRQAETTLGLLLGITPQEFRLESEPIDQLAVPAIAPWAPGEMLLRRPDMAGAELDMISARANLASVRASLIPLTLNLSASGNSGSQELFALTDARTFSLGATLSIAESIFNFRQRRTNVLNAESNEYIALLNYAQTIRQALKDVDDTLATANTNLLAEESQQRTLAQAQRAFELAEVELREGSAAPQELLDAQRSLFTAQNSLLTARIQRLNTAVNLYVALGGGWPGPGDR